MNKNLLYDACDIIAVCDGCKCELNTDMTIISSSLGAFHSWECFYSKAKSYLNVIMLAQSETLFCEECQTTHSVDQLIICDETDYKVCSDECLESYLKRYFNAKVLTNYNDEGLHTVT